MHLIGLPHLRHTFTPPDTFVQVVAAKRRCTVFALNAFRTVRPLPEIVIERELAELPISVLEAGEQNDSALARPTFVSAFAMQPQ